MNFIALNQGFEKSRFSKIWSKTEHAHFGTTCSSLQFCTTREREDNEEALHSVMSVVCALVGHIKTLDCLSVSDAADREGGLKRSINPHTPFTVQVSSVSIHSPTVQLHKQITH